MKIVTYVTFSELYDREPTREELLASVRALDRERALIILIRMNLALRYVMHNDEKNFGRLEETLAATFCDDETLRRYRQRFLHNRADEKPLFVPIHCLNVLRLTITEAGDLVPPPSDEDLQYLLGRCCLMTANFLYTKEERQQIEQHESEAKRLTLMVQALSTFELSNPVSKHRMTIRYQQMYRTVLQMEWVRKRIKAECSSFDFDEVFEEVTNVRLERWLHSIFAIHGYFLLSADPLNSDERYFVIDPDNFIGMSDLSKPEAQAILATIASSLDDLKEEFSNENHTDPRFDFIPFRTKPLVRISGKLACLDLTFLMNQVHTGVHWILHDRLSSRRRSDLFSAWGVLFEEYMHYLFEGMETSLPIRYFRSPRWTKCAKDNIGQESFDGIFVKSSVLFAMEFKGGFLSRRARYSGDINLFVSEMRKKFGGVQQLAWKIGALFDENAANRRGIEHINADSYEVVVPIFVLQDHIFDVPFLNWWLNLEFQRTLNNYRLRPNIKIEPLNVVTIREIEAMINSAETTNFDFLYALHNRAVRDPNMVGNLREFLFQFSEFGKGNSKRTQRILDQFDTELWRTLFPNEKRD